MSAMTDSTREVGLLMQKGVKSAHIRQWWIFTAGRIESGGQVHYGLTVRVFGSQLLVGVMVPVEQ